MMCIVGYGVLFVGVVIMYGFVWCGCGFGGKVVIGYFEIGGLIGVFVWISVMFK